jgi:hypothetical protein
VREVKSFGRKLRNRRYRDAIDQSFRAALRLLRRSVFGPVVAFLVLAASRWCCGLAGARCWKSRLTGGELIGLIYGLTGTSFGSLVSLYTAFPEALSATSACSTLDERGGHEDAGGITLGSVEGQSTSSN